ncbi:hypothetical protein [Sulfurospirillum multivorans]|uniref:Uncharacterized protein n=2 Tax=Sulfurospirillum multivorans TaxID=66821 RepID=A0AA86DZP5_SULMK|nr:hypothetical protein [Sulfurospirillum multivorans]AHJ13030.1 hypothetical protein SMUL_1775 [Sulfurospirillum multivorans DSM 12446]QEH06521.1 hypothetical protein SMN_1756 [Sulfurospirillum multivorans]
MLLLNYSKKEWFLIGAGVMIYILGLLYSASFDLNYLDTSFREFTIRFFVCSLIWVVPSSTSTITKGIGFEQSSDFHSFQYLFEKDGSFIGAATLLLIMVTIFSIGALIIDYIEKNSSNKENGTSFEKEMKTSKKIQITLPSSTITMVIVIVVSYFLAVAKFDQLLSMLSGFVMVFTCLMLLGAIAEGGTYEFIEPEQEEPVIKGEVE